MEPPSPHVLELPLGSQDEPPLKAIPVEDLARMVLERENLDSQELARCRCEVLLQLALSSPEDMLIVYRARSGPAHG